MKLYDLYEVVSNKTVRKNERYYKRFKAPRSVPGILVKTNRGWFIDGHQVDLKAVDTWFNILNSTKNGKN